MIFRGPLESEQLFLKKHFSVIML